MNKRKTVVNIIRKFANRYKIDLNSSREFFELEDEFEEFLDSQNIKITFAQLLEDCFNLNQLTSKNLSVVSNFDIKFFASGFPKTEKYTVEDYLYSVYFRWSTNAIIDQEPYIDIAFEEYLRFVDYKTKSINAGEQAKLKQLFLRYDESNHRIIIDYDEMQDLLYSIPGKPLYRALYENFFSIFFNYLEFDYDDSYNSCFMKNMLWYIRKDQHVFHKT